jgi:putative Holliday junction resolvase
MAAAGRFLGVDYGTRRIGLAVSDSEARIAFPEGTLERRGTRRDLEAICKLVAERGVAGIVVGLPLHMDARRGPEAEAAETFARALGEATGLPVELLDERWTTLEAERALRESGRKGKKRRAVVDAVAATLLLRTWLERRSALALAQAPESRGGGA